METTIADAVRSLAAEQDRVAAIVGSLTPAGWEAQLMPLGLERLLTMGHFPEYVSELDWTPREVVGHLRDSADVFTERIARLRSEDRPAFEDFVTDDPARLSEYRETDPEDLAEQLTASQERLLAAVRSVEPDELTRWGVHEVEGELTLGEVIAFLPEHQRDHREQLSALTAEALG